jgi:hypothetical protein
VGLKVAYPGLWVARGVLHYLLSIMVALIGNIEHDIHEVIIHKRSWSFIFLHDYMPNELKV